MMPPTWAPRWTEKARAILTFNRPRPASMKIRKIRTRKKVERKERNVPSEARAIEPSFSTFMLFSQTRGSQGVDSRPRLVWSELIMSVNFWPYLGISEAKLLPLS